MPDQKLDLMGLQSLVAHPDGRVFLVRGQKDFEAAQRLFPHNPVLGWEGSIHDYYLGHLAQRGIIVWPDNPLPQKSRAIADSLKHVETKGMVIFSPDAAIECLSVREVEAKRLPKTWFLQRMKPVAYEPEPASMPADEYLRLNGKANGAHAGAGPAQPTPEPAVEPVAPPTQSEAQVMAQAPKTKRKKRERTEGTSWADFGLVLNDDGIPLATLDNAVHVIEQHPDLAGNIWYDSFLSKILHTWGTDKAAEWSDYDDIRLALYMQRDIGIPRLSPALAADAAICYAHREVRNCVYDWLDGLRWDGRERLCLLGTLGFGAESSDYTAAVCRNLILAMVKRIFSPGCKSDYMPVFEGQQGEGKSKALALLGGEWFAELHMDWNNKDFYSALQGKMLVEIGELHAFKQTDVDKIKGIVSCPTDRYREPFGRHTRDYPRQCVFAGTTNRDNWNRDDTGARRFWPIMCGTIDHAWIAENREQLFAEAVHVIRGGGSYWEVPWDEAKMQQDDRREVDTWEDSVSSWLVGRVKCTLGEVMFGAVDIPSSHQTLSDQQRMGRVMKKMGWVKRNERVNGVQRKVWCNPLTLDLPE